MPRTTRRLLILICLASVALSVPRAAKLVFLRNGRVLHAEEVRLSEGWYTVTLARRSTIVIPAALTLAASLRASRAESDLIHRALNEAESVIRQTGAVFYAPRLAEERKLATG